MQWDLLLQTVQCLSHKCNTQFNPNLQIFSHLIYLNRKIWKTHGTWPPIYFQLIWDQINFFCFNDFTLLCLWKWQCHTLQQDKANVNYREKMPLCICWTLYYRELLKTLPELLRTMPCCETGSQAVCKLANCLRKNRGCDKCKGEIRNTRSIWNYERIAVRKSIKHRQNEVGDKQ